MRRRFWRFHKSIAPEEAWTHHGCGEFSGVNGTPLLRGIEFTHAPAQATEMMAEEWLESNLNAVKKIKKMNHSTD
jgi:hypothetical protein